MTKGILGTVQLNDEISRYAPRDDASGRRAETLIKTDRLRVVLVTMRAGSALHEHAAPGVITIHCLKGNLDVTVGTTHHDLARGSMIALDAGVLHSVRARSEGAFLLTIVLDDQTGRDALASA